MKVNVFLGNKCNFRCAHCLIPQGEGTFSKPWTSQDSDAIAEFCRKSGAISVKLCGGEPTLFPDAIRCVRSKLPKGIRLGIVTNAWFGDKASSFFDSNPLDFLEISFDRFHTEFIDAQTVLCVIRSAMERKLPVTLTSVIESHQDFKLLQPFFELNIDFEITERVDSWLPASGRRRSRLSSDRSTKICCPDSQENPQGLCENVLYIPGMGFSPCTSRLVFEGRVPINQIFSSNYEEFSENALRERVHGVGLENLVKQCGEHLDINSEIPCDCCVFLNAFGIVSPDLPSIVDLVKRAGKIEKISSRLDPVTEDFFLQRHLVRYALHGNLCDINIDMMFPYNESHHINLQEKVLSPADIDFYMNSTVFINDIFRQKSGFSSAMVAHFDNALRKGFAGELGEFRAISFLYDGEYVASIIGIFERDGSLRTDGQPSLYLGDYGIIAPKFQSNVNLTNYVRRRSFEVLREWSLDGGFGGRYSIIVEAGMYEDIEFFQCLGAVLSGVQFLRRK